MTIKEDNSFTQPEIARPDMPQRLLLLLVALVFLVASTLYSFAVPVYEAQDEKPHFEFIRFIAKEGRLPDFRNSDDARAAGIQSIQTPLYYLFQGVLLRISGNSDINFAFEKNPFRSKAAPAIYYHSNEGERFPYAGKYRVFHWLRLTNILAGIITLLVIYRAVSLMEPGDGFLPVAATAFVALIPQFTYICGTISNDAFSILFASLTLYFMLRFILSPSAEPKLVVLMSVAVSLAVLSKQMTLCLIPVCYAATVVKGGRKDKIKNLSAMTIVVAALIGWYYARNLLLFGDVFNLSTQMKEFSFLLVERKTFSQFFGTYLPDYFAPRFIKSFWGSFGYTTVWMGPGAYLFYNVIAGVGLISLVTGSLDPDFRNRFSRHQKTGLALLAGAVVMLFAQIAAFNFSLSQPQGRYGFCALSCLAIFWALGMDRLIRGKQCHKNLSYALLIFLFALMNFHALGCVLRKAFSPPPRSIDVMQQKGQSYRLSLNKSTAVGQTFHCDIDDLDQVAVKFHARGEYRNCQVIFRLRSIAEPSIDLVRLTVPGNSIHDQAYRFFTFPALTDSKGKDYEFVLEAVDERGYAGIDCYHTDEDVYNDGTAMENGRPLPLDLTFSTGSG